MAKNFSSDNRMVENLGVLFVCLRAWDFKTVRKFVKINQ